MIKEKLNVLLNEGWSRLYCPSYRKWQKWMRSCKRFMKLQRSAGNFEYREVFLPYRFWWRFRIFLSFYNTFKVFAHRLITKSSYQDEQSDDLLDLIKIKYKNAYACCLKNQTIFKNKLCIWFITGRNVIFNNTYRKSCI